MIRTILVALALIGYASAAWAQGAQSCPANSHEISRSDAGVRCACDVGYTMQGGQCVKQ